MARDYVQDYFPSSDPEAPLGTLREVTGLTDEDEVSDGALTRACKVAVQMAEEVMGGLRGCKRELTRYVVGSGARFLELPEPLFVLNSVSIVDPVTKEVEEELAPEVDFVPHDVWVGSDGGWERYRLYPRLAKRTDTWRVGLVYAIDGEWGMVDEDGETPAPMQRAIARLVVLEAAPVADEDANERRRVGAQTGHRVAGRSVTFRSESAGIGRITEQWVLETLAGYRLPRVSASAAHYPANYEVGA